MANVEPFEECARLGKIISTHPIDVAFVGIGAKACHLAFNDPPAYFETENAYLVVNLNEACRKQQLGEGWFKTLQEVPEQAISMSIKQIMKAKAIICCVPDIRKADAVKKLLKVKSHHQYLLQLCGSMKQAGYIWIAIQLQC